MRSLLRDSPFFNYSTPLVYPNGAPVLDPFGAPLLALRNQLILWARLLIPGQNVTHQGTAFPILVDSGFSDTFLIREEQFLFWTGLPRNSLTPALMGKSQFELVLTSTTRFRKWQASLVIQPNMPGQRDTPDSSAIPIHLPFASGFAIWTSNVPYDRRTRLPLLGMQGLHEFGAILEIDGKRRLAQMTV
jgi:hypothetical protein